MKLVGEKAIAPFLVELEKDAIKMAKIKECCEKAVITVKVSGVKKERPTSAPVKSAAPKPTKTAPAPKSAPQLIKPSTAPKKKAPVINSATVVRPKGKNTAAKKQAGERELSDEQVDELVSFVSPNTIGQMSDTSYKIR